MVALWGSHKSKDFDNTTAMILNGNIIILLSIARLSEIFTLPARVCSRHPSILYHFTIFISNLHPLVVLFHWKNIFSCFIHIGVCYRHFYTKASVNPAKRIVLHSSGTIDGRLVVVNLYFVITLQAFFSNIATNMF